MSRIIAFNTATYRSQHILLESVFHNIPRKVSHFENGIYGIYIGLSIIFNRNLTVKAINRSIASRVVFGSTPRWKAKACASIVPSSQTSIATYDHVEPRKSLS